MIADKNLVGSHSTTKSVELKAAKNQNQSADETNRTINSSDTLEIISRPNPQLNGSIVAIEQSVAPNSISLKHLIAAAHAKRRARASNLQSSTHDSALPSTVLSAFAVRDAFEGMVETLTRTKDSIGRATRLAIDCAKYDLANEVVELLIQKMENEPCFHRRVDLFFLVDSIMQCSHSQKGIAKASYIPTVQAVLPRLLRAVAPLGSGAKENRRHCLKVLRVWLERKVLPEPLLRRYMDDIQV